MRMLTSPSICSLRSLLSLRNLKIVALLLFDSGPPYCIFQVSLRPSTFRIVYSWHQETVLEVRPLLEVERSNSGRVPFAFILVSQAPYTGLRANQRHTKSFITSNWPADSFDKPKSATPRRFALSIPCWRRTRSPFTIVHFNDTDQFLGPCEDLGDWDDLQGSLATQPNSAIDKANAILQPKISAS